MNSIYFGISSNLGGRLQNLRDAIDMLKTLGNIACVIYLSREEKL